MATKKKTRKVTKKTVKRTKVKTKAKKSPRVAKAAVLPALSTTSTRRKDLAKVAKMAADAIKSELTRDGDCRKYLPAVPVTEKTSPSGPNPKFPVWEGAKCGACGHDASNDPNGERYLYKLTCPTCEKEGCDECMPAGRGCECPECEESDSGDEVVDEDPGVDEDVEEEPNG
jgi:hypothetical protein